MISYGAREEQAVDYLVMWLRIRAPKDTWNLTNHGIRKVWNPVRFSWEVVIGGEPAPYAIYTNEPWISTKWHGAINPNQGWIQMAVEEAKPTLIGILSGVITEQDYQDLMSKATNQLSAMSIQAAERVV